MSNSKSGLTKRKPYDQISTDDNDDSRNKKEDHVDDNDELELTDKQIS